MSDDTKAQCPVDPQWYPEIRPNHTEKVLYLMLTRAQSLSLINHLIKKQSETYWDTILGVSNVELANLKAEGYTEIRVVIRSYDDSEL